jgi:hypothetical protein
MSISVIADTVAAAAIVLSLCFVAWELHQTRVQSELSNWREILASLTEFKAITNDLGYAEFLARAHADYHALSDAEKLSFGKYCEQGVHIFGNFLKHNESLPRKLAGLDQAVGVHFAELLTTPGGAAWWEEAQERGIFMPGTYVVTNQLLKHHAKRVG